MTMLTFQYTSKITNYSGFKKVKVIQEKMWNWYQHYADDTVHVIQFLSIVWKLLFQLQLLLCAWCTVQYCSLQNCMCLL